MSTADPVPLFDLDDDLGWPDCLNPDCDNPGTVTLTIFGQPVGSACRSCASYATSRTSARPGRRMPVIPADAEIDGKHRHGQPDTSARAAVPAERWRRGTARVKLARAHYDHPDGLTDVEAAQLAGIAQGSSPWRRCGELRDWGYLEETDLERPTPTGAAAVVWRLTPEGRAALEDAGHVDREDAA